MKAYYSDHFVLPLPPGHRFPMVKYRMLRDQLTQALPSLQLMEAPGASDGELALAHSPSYVAAVVNGTLAATAQREIGFPWSSFMVERARRSVGATVAAARNALQDGQPLRVAVIDLDVHQGNGTARIFQDDDSVFTLSLHGDKNFPFSKERGDLDVARPMRV